MYAVQRKSEKKYPLDNVYINFIEEYELPKKYDCFNLTPIYQEAATQYLQNFTDNINRQLFKKIMCFYRVIMKKTHEEAFQLTKLKLNCDIEVDE